MFSQPNLLGRSVDRHQTLLRVRRGPIFIKIRPETCRLPPPQKWQLQSPNIKISVRFQTTLRLDRDYLRQRWKWVSGSWIMGQMGHHFWMSHVSHWSLPVTH